MHNDGICALSPMKTRSTWFGILAGALLLIGAGPMVLAADAPASFRVLVFSKTTGYRHASITNGIATLRELGAQNGFAVEATEDSGAFTAASLAGYAAVVFLSATGNVLDSDQKSALKTYVTEGGGFMAIHGAVFGPLACEDQWAWYGEMFCCAFTNHSQVVPAMVTLSDAAHASNTGLPAQWQRTDEWYNFTGTPRGCARILATVDETTYAGGRMGKDHPLVWCRQVGRGRMWYTAMGHTESSFAEPLFRKHLLGGILVTAGRVPADF
jgi:type 1 glutamine amidotransferase